LEVDDAAGNGVFHIGLGLFPMTNCLHHHGNYSPNKNACKNPIRYKKEI